MKRTAVAGLLVVAAAAMAVAAFATGGDGEAADAEPAPTPAAVAAGDRGLAVWAAQGCGSCHTLAAADARGEVGPDLGAALRGQPASAIRTSIVDPNASGGPSIMPEDFGTRIRPADLAALVAFLDRAAG